MPGRNGLLFAGLLLMACGIAVLSSAVASARSSAAPPSSGLTVVAIDAGCGPLGVTGTVTIVNTTDRYISDGLPFRLMQHIPPSRGGGSEFIPVPGGGFVIDVLVAPGETVTVPFGPLPVDAVDPAANTLRVDTDTIARPDLNPEKSESFGPCGGVTPTPTQTVPATATSTPGTHTASPTAMRTLTPVPPSATHTPASSATHTHTPAPPTATHTPVPTATHTPTPVPPSATHTPATATSTQTPVPPSATHTPVPTATTTQTPVPPTATHTSVPSATRTLTPVPPSATHTPVPSATRTLTPVPPTATRTHAPGPPRSTPTRTPVQTSASPTPPPPSATPTRVSLVLGPTPRPGFPELPRAGVAPGQPGMPLGWLIAGGMMSLLGFAIVTGTFADMRRALPATLYVRFSGLRSFEEFYDVVVRLEGSLPAQAATATAFDADERRGDVRLDGVTGRQRAVLAAARRATARALRLRRTSRDRVTIELD